MPPDSTFKIQECQTGLIGLVEFFMLIFVFKHKMIPQSKFETEFELVLTLIHQSLNSYAYFN